MTFVRKMLNSNALIANFSSTHLGTDSSLRIKQSLVTETLLTLPIQLYGIISFFFSLSLSNTTGTVKLLGSLKFSY